MLLKQWYDVLSVSFYLYIQLSCVNKYLVMQWLVYLIPTVWCEWEAWWARWWIWSLDLLPIWRPTPPTHCLGLPQLVNHGYCPGNRQSLQHVLKCVLCVGVVCYSLSPLTFNAYFKQFSGPQYVYWRSREQFLKSWSLKKNKF